MLALRIVFLFSFLAAGHVNAAPQIFSPIEKSRSRDSYVAKGKNGVVATAHPLASEAAIAMLKKGGNAFDAAVAASFVISVVRPQSTGLGGGGFLLGTEARKSDVLVYDFRERAPAAASRDMYIEKDGTEKNFTYDGKTVPNASVNGHLSVGVPGLVAGLVKVQEEKGALKLAEVLQPAIKIAVQGFPVYEGLAKEILERREILEVFPDSRRIFLPEGKPLTAGQLLVQKDLAWTLRQIAERGAAGFYQGEVGKRLVAEMQRGKGLMTADDLKQYKVKMREPVTGTYRGYRIVSMPPPSSGGVHIVQMLNMLGQTKYGELPHGSAASIHLLAEVMRRAFADRAEYLGDPDFVKVPVKGLTSAAYAKALYATIDPNKATASDKVKPGTPQSYESPSTTHLSVVDGEGNAVTSTQTVNYSFGSCVVAQGTGVILNDEMDDFSKKPGTANVYGLLGNEANAIAAGKTMLSSMSPTFVFDPKGRLSLALGSPGGPRIINATLQTIINVVDHKMPLETAVHAARIHHQWYPDEIRVEPETLTPQVQKDLGAMGHKIAVKGAVGDVQAVGIEAGTLIGVSDTRSEGRPMGY
jgi:gamma-glutamyltranspeptidase/glutathione hydrolase